jgi:uncharacterized protein
MGEAAQGRIAALDLVRGVAVLGILAVNIAGFSGPSLATLTPNWPNPASLADKVAFAAIFVVFEGKMRLLFTMLFGASMVLFVERAELAGRNGNVLQVRRLLWLLVFGYLHFILLWWGDILVLYALLGLVALSLQRIKPGALVIGALAFYLLWHSAGMIDTALDLAGVDAVQNGTAGAQIVKEQQSTIQRFLDRADADFATVQLGFLAQAWHRASVEWAMPLRVALASIGETLPMMALGMALYRSRFFAGLWPRKWMQALAWGGSACGLLPTLALLDWAWSRDFPIPAMFQFNVYWSAIPHVLMGMGYAAGLILAAPWLLSTWLGQRLQAAGRMAFSNYIGTSILMTAIFSGWGLGLAGHYTHTQLPLFVLAVWALMLGWSRPWLARFRQGPLEWLWRSLTEGRRLPFRRAGSEP